MFICLRLPYRVIDDIIPRSTRIINIDIILVSDFYLILKPPTYPLQPIQHFNLWIAYGETTMDRYGTKPLVEVDRGYHSQPFNPPRMPSVNPGDVGILKSTILPSLALHTGLSLTSYILSRATETGEVKDWFWPSSQVIDAWWSAIGRPMYHQNLPFSTAWGRLSWTEKLLLSCITIWGTRLFYRISSRTISRGKDDPRYTEMKAKDPNFWDTAFYKAYLPEAAFLTLISLPFTLPFRLSQSTFAFSPKASATLRTSGVALFGIGFTLEVLADSQLQLHRKERTDLCRHGVWSIVRHPK